LTAQVQAKAKFKLPDLPEGVIPDRPPAGDDLVLAMDETPMALDDAFDCFGYANQGWGGQSLGIAGVAFPGYPFLALLSQISEYRSPSETISTEMTRKWIKFHTTKGDADEKIKALEAAFKAFKVQDLFRRAALQDGFFGRSQIYIAIKGQTDDRQRQLPLLVNQKTVGVGCLLGLKVIEPYWTSPYSYNTVDPTAPDFYKPTSWFVVGKKTHATRLLTFISREVPDILKPAYNFSGLSLNQLMIPYVNQWLRTRDSVSNLLHSFSTTVLETDMQSTLGDDTGGTGLISRMQLFIQNRDNQGLMVTNKDTEALTQLNAPISGLDALQAQSQEHMSAPSHIPLVKLFGITPSGLNASSAEEITVFYDFVRAAQENLYAEHLDTILNLMQLHLFGVIDAAIGYEWVSLTEMEGEALSRVRKSDGDAAVQYINAGVISPEEERERLASDPSSGYNNLAAGEVPDPLEDEEDPDEDDDGDKEADVDEDAVEEEAA
jgi:phage-related protein (TIGR01555 family)